MKHGFTVAELIVAFIILGTIALFTIPKTLNASGNDSSQAILSETMGMIGQTFKHYQSDNTVTGTTTGMDLLAYMNYIGTVPGDLDGVNNGIRVSWPCGADMQCVQLHNGAYLGVPFRGFGRVAPGNNCLWYLLDVDGSPTTNGVPSNRDNSIWLALYPNGLMRPWSFIEPNTRSLVAGGAVISQPRPGSDPSWVPW